MELRSLPYRYTRRVVVDNPTSAGRKRVRFSELESSLHGRPTHLMGVHIRASVPYTAVGLTMPGALPGELLAALFANIRLRTQNHDFIRGLDGFDIVRLTRFRFGRDAFAAADIADADGSGTVDLSLFVPFGRIGADGSRMFDWAIPVAAFEGDRNAGSGLEFDIDTAARAFPGVTFSAPTSVTVHANLVALDDLRLTAWEWWAEDVAETYIDRRVDAGPIETLILTSMDGSTGSETVAGAEATLKVGNQIVFDGLTASDLRMGLILQRYADPLPPTPGQEGGEKWLPIVTSSPHTRRTKMPRGRVRVELAGTVPSPKRWLFAAGGLFTDEKLRAMARAVGAPFAADGTPDALIRPATDKGDITRGAAAILDQKIYWKGMPFGLPASKVAKL